jgi:AGCS family alanine or glycine:cation symporter
MELPNAEIKSSEYWSCTKFADWESRSTILSGIFITTFILVIFLGGIKRIGAFSAKLIPVMFILYIGASLLILCINVDKLGSIFHDMFHSALSPMAMASGTLVGGIVSTLRWEIFKGTQACEAGIGT